MAKQTNPMSNSGQDDPEQSVPATEAQPDAATQAPPAPAAPSGSATDAAPIPVPPAKPGVDSSSASQSEPLAPAKKPVAAAAGKSQRELTAAGTAKPCSCESETSRSTFNCAPCSDPIATVSRVVRDPNVSHAVSELLGSEAVTAYFGTAPKGVKGALEGIAKAFAGTDAVRAKGESCQGRLRLLFEIEDALTGTREPLDPQLVSKIAVNLLDENYNLASASSKFEDKALVFSQVEAKPVRVSLDASLIETAEISDDFEVKYPNQKEFQKYRRLPSSNTGAVIADVTLALTDNGANSEGNESFTLVATLTPVPNWPPPSGTISFYAYPDPSQGSITTLLGNASFKVKDGTAECDVTAGQGPGELLDGVYAITANYSGDSNYAPSTSTPLAVNVGQYGVDTRVAPARGDVSSSEPAVSSIATSSDAGSATAAAAGTPMPGYLIQIFAGMESIMKLILRPPLAHVRCFSWLDGEGAGCLQGNQYISRVAINAVHGETSACKMTSDSGCAGFRLNPGWYRFSAPECITIEGCNYALASSSPVSAFLGAGQSCSDIFFRYRKKGSEIEVISEILYPDPGNPYHESKNVFPGMEYLLLRENDPTFLQQQTATDGSPVYFRNLAAGPYLLFCQAPEAYGSQPVQPVHPQGGRLALTVFGGQTSAVPVKVKFQTGNTAPAVLDGYVRDDTGMPIVGQVVWVENAAGCRVAAGVTDSTGKYSIQLYTAENVTIVAGSQQVTVSKAQIQAAMKQVGSPAPPSPSASLDQAMQRSELVAFNN